MLRSLIITALFATTSAANAAVIGFDGLTDDWFPLDPYVEAGFEVSTWNLLGGNGFLHLDIALGPFAQSYIMTQVGGGSFSFHSLDLVPLGPDNQFPTNPQNDFTLIGYRGGAVVGQLYGTAQNGGETLTGTAAFGNVDTLALTGLMTQNVMDAFDAGNFFDVHLGVDNISVGAPIVTPLPAAGLLLAGAMGGLSVLASRRRRSA